MSKYDETWLEREFIGYGYHTPNPQWPGNAKIAVSFIVQYMMGAEHHTLNGDAHSETYLLELPRPAPTMGRNENEETPIEYGATMGVPRLLGLFNKCVASGCGS